VVPATVSYTRFSEGFDTADLKAAGWTLAGASTMSFSDLSSAVTPSLGVATRSSNAKSGLTLTRNGVADRRFFDLTTQFALE
jgi:hypothetical protein